MSIDRTTVKRVARLARIRVEDSELDHLAREMSGILTWIEQLQAVPTDGVQPLASVSGNTLRWRDDVVTDGDKPADVLANAPGAVEGFFSVPKVVE